MTTHYSPRVARSDPTRPIPPSVIRSDRVVPLHTPVELGETRDAGHRIELQRDGDRIVAIHVFCRCGEQIVLKCDE